MILFVFIWNLDADFINDHSGSTAVIALLTKNNVLYVSNAGDSRAVISTKDGKAIPLTQDHKPKLPKESERIKNAGGFVEAGRVNGKYQSTITYTRHLFPSIQEVWLYQELLVILISRKIPKSHQIFKW